MYPDTIRVHRSHLLRVASLSDEMHLLDLVTDLPTDNPKLPCVVLAHNEGHILREFLDHYRRVGVDRFYIVDDRSTDGSSEILRSQQDVTVYSPVEGSTYARDKRYWRSQLMDRHCSGRWVLVPDLDEHLVYRDSESRDIFALIRSLEDEGAEALHALMLDMYSNNSLNAHRHNCGRLIDSFPLFDGPDHYFRIAAPAKFRAKYPVPFALAIGGMRQRLFDPLAMQRGSPSARLLRGLCDIGGDFSPDGFERLKLQWARFKLKPLLRSVALYNCSKIPLLKWRKGMWFYNGAHAVSQPLRLSRQRAALLHFKFAAGVDALRYTAIRGQHASGSQFYKRILTQDQVLASSPVFEGSHLYYSSQSLGRFLS